MPDHLIKIERITPQKMCKKSHQQFVARGEVDRRKGRRIHIHACLPRQDGIGKVGQLRKGPMEIDDVILIGTQNKKNSAPDGQAHRRK